MGGEGASLSGFESVVLESCGKSCVCGVDVPLLKKSGVVCQGVTLFRDVNRFSEKSGVVFQA